MRSIARLSPGNVPSTILTSALCSAACHYMEAARPASFPLSIVSAASSFIIYLGVLAITSLQSSFRWNKTASSSPEEVKVAKVVTAGNQLTLTLAHTALWLASTVIFTADLSEALSPPTSLECPSTRCSEYTLGSIITHLLLFTFVAQLLGFALIIYESQSAPRRVSADKTLSSILQKSTAQLSSLREEIRHARALGSTPSPYSPMSMLHSAPRAHPLARRTGSLGNSPSFGRYSVEDREESGRRRKMRTVSSSTSLEDTATWGREFPWGETSPRVIDLNVDGPDDTLVESFDASYGEVIGKSDRPGKPRQVTFSDEPSSIIEPLTPSDRQTRDLRSAPLRRSSSTPVSASPEVSGHHAEGQNSLGT